MTAFLFDLDGTLADTLPLIVQSSQLALGELGHEARDEEIIALIGIPLVETGEVLLGPGRGEEYRDCYQRHFRSLDSSQLQAFEGIAQLLATLKQAGGKLACVTSKRQLPAEQTLSQLGLSSYFDVLITAENCARHKPHPAPALQALAELQAEKEQALFIGDSIFDIGCALNAGILSVGVTWGAAREEDLRAAAASYIAHTVGQLQEILLGQLAAWVQ